MLLHSVSEQLEQIIFVLLNSYQICNLPTGILDKMWHYVSISTFLMQLFQFWCHCNLTADCLYKISQYKYLWGIDNIWWWFYPSASAMQSYVCLLKSKPQLCSLGLTYIDCSLKYFYKLLKFLFDDGEHSVPFKSLRFFWILHVFEMKRK